jgi:hypothetical protein
MNIRSGINVNFSTTHALTPWIIALSGEETYESNIYGGTNSVPTEDMSWVLSTHR